MDDAIRAFDPLRPRLQGIAYRMLGSVAEAEDVVQDAWLRWQRAEHDAVRDPRAFLARTVTRLCLDVMKSARAQREMRAKEMCRTCPVLAQCRTHALAVGEPYGIWGGLSESEREMLLKRGIRRTA